MYKTIVIFIELKPPATSFSDERFNLNRIRSLRKRRNTKSNINGRFLRRRPKFLASILCTNVVITGKSNSKTLCSYEF